MQKLLVTSVVLLLACASVAAEKKATDAIPDLAGVWLLDPLASHGGSLPHDTTVLLIRQSGNEITFEHYATRELEREPKVVEQFVANGRSSRRYATRTQVAYATAKFAKGVLVIDTTTSLDAQGTQTFSDTERWAVSPDGKTLTERMSDGTVVVYQKQGPVPTAQ